MSFLHHAKRGVQMLAGCVFACVLVALWFYTFFVAERFDNSPWRFLGRLFTQEGPHCFDCNRTAYTPASYRGATVKWFCSRHPAPQVIGSVSSTWVVRNGASLLLCVFSLACVFTAFWGGYALIADKPGGMPMESGTGSSDFLTLLMTGLQQTVPGTVVAALLLYGMAFLVAHLKTWISFIPDTW